MGSQFTLDRIRTVDALVGGCLYLKRDEASGMPVGDDGGPVYLGTCALLGIDAIDQSCAQCPSRRRA